MASFNITPTFNHEGKSPGGRVSIDKLTMYERTGVPTILYPYGRVYFEYDINAHFEDTKNDDYPKIEFRLNPVFCKNFEGVKILSNVSMIVFFLKE